MNMKLAFPAILLLIGLTLSGCVAWGGYGYHPGYDYGYGHDGYPYGHYDYNDGYPYRHHPRDWDDHHHW